jgi:hypothetical protein
MSSVNKISDFILEYIEIRGSVDSIASGSGGGGRMVILTEVFRDFSQSLNTNFGVLPKIMPRCLPATSFLLNYSSCHSKLHSVNICTGIQ